MGFDLHLMPASGFREWSDDERLQYVEKSNQFSERLGRSAYVGLVLDLIIHHLESGKPGSQFPLVMRLETDDSGGWEHEELGSLLRELAAITERLAALPVNDATIRCGDAQWAAKFAADFTRHNPGHPLNNLADLTSYFFETLRAFASRAQAEGKGVFVSY